MNTLPSKYQLGDEVSTVFGFQKIPACRVIKVHFTDAKTLYDLEVTLGEGSFGATGVTRMYNVDECHLQPKDLADYYGVLQFVLGFIKGYASHLPIDKRIVITYDALTINLHKESKGDLCPTVVLSRRFMETQFSFARSSTELSTYLHSQIVKL